MLFEQLRSGGCLSYVVGCEQTCAGVIVDPALELLDHYVALATEKGLRVRYLIDTHTHADHFSAARELARQLGARIVTHRLPAPPTFRPAAPRPSTRASSRSSCGSTTGCAYFRRTTTRGANGARSAPRR